MRRSRFRAGHGRADRIEQGRLVALGDHQVVAVLSFGDAAGGLSLGVQGIQGQDRPGQVQPGGDVLQLRNLICLGIDLPLGTGVPAGHVEDGQQVHLAAVRPDGVAHGLAVRGGLGLQPSRSGPGLRGAARRCSRSCTVTCGSGQVGMPSRASRQPCTATPKASASIFTKTRENARARCLDPPGPQVTAPAQEGQGLLRAARRPFGDRHRGVVPGSGERADRQRQHVLQLVPAPQR